GPPFFKNAFCSGRKSNSAHAEIPIGLATSSRFRQTGAWSDRPCPDATRANVGDPLANLRGLWPSTLFDKLIHVTGVLVWPCGTHSAQPRRTAYAISVQPSTKFRPTMVARCGWLRSFANILGRK